MALAVITGASSGIGKHLAQVMAKCGVHVIAAGRRKALLTEVAKTSTLITPVTADVTQPEGVAAITAAVQASGLPVRYLVQNAGLLGDIKPLGSYDHEAWRSVMSTNVDAPLFLVQALLPHMTQGSRILHVSSGAAHSAIAGWGAYCVSKAAFHMMWKCLGLELAGQGILVGSVRPGVVDTPMQVAIRAGDEAAFPDKARFLSLHEKRVQLDSAASASSGADAQASAGSGAPATATAAAAPPPNGALDTPENVALFLNWLLVETADAEFGAAEWDIREKSHQHRWATSAQGPQ